MDLTDPVAATLAVARALDAAGARSAVYGGLALAVYGEPRETKDADLAVAGLATGRALAALEAAGLDVAVSFERMTFGGNLVTRFALLGAPAASGLNVADLVEPRSARFAAAALERAVTGTLRGEPVTVLSPEDFVLFKVLSTRERDLEDAASVVRALGPALDMAAVEREAATLAREIPDHDVAGRMRRIVDLAPNP